MYYVELMRGRRLLTWYGSIVAALLLLGLFFAFKDGPPQMHIGAGQTVGIPLQAILAACAFGPVILAAFMAVGLDAEYKTVAITWTRPMSRIAIALRNVAVDAGTLLVAWLITLVAALIALGAVGLLRYLVVAQKDGSMIAVVLGAAVMWYGLVTLVTTLLPGRGNAVAGGSWAYALIIPGMTAVPFPAAIHQLFVALNYLNPMAYIGSFTSDSHGGSHASGHLLAGSVSADAAIAWLIGIAATAIGVYLWSHREVPA